MSKWIKILFVAVCLWGCNSENAPDCFQAEGDRVAVSMDVPAFSAITVFENIELVLKQGPVQEVRIETGSNLLPEVTAEVVDGRLILRDENDCNFVRDYKTTTITVTTPTLTEVRSSTGFSVRSEGVLTFPSLSLVSESFNNPETATTDGEFDLELDCDWVSIVVNGIAYFRLKGNTNTFNVTIAAGDSRIAAEELVAQEVRVNHRGSNDLLVYPVQSIGGTIRGNGDVLSFNKPPVVSVDEIYKGRLIFQ